MNIWVSAYKLASFFRFDNVFSALVGSARNSAMRVYAAVYFPISKWPFRNGKSSDQSGYFTA